MTKVFGFPARFRIKNSNDFAEVLRAPTRQKITTPNLILFISPHPQSNAKLGIITSKKNFPNACTRNYLKRLARESFRLNHSKLKKLAILVLFHKNAALIEAQSLQIELRQAFNNEMLLEKNNSK